MVHTNRRDLSKQLARAKHKKRTRRKERVKKTYRPNRHSKKRNKLTKRYVRSRKNKRTRNKMKGGRLLIGRTGKKVLKVVPSPPACGWHTAAARSSDAPLC